MTVRCFTLQMEENKADHIVDANDGAQDKCCVHHDELPLSQ